MGWEYKPPVDIQALVGHTFSSVRLADDKESIDFLKEDGTGFRMYHSQDCCEAVWVESVTGDLSDLEGTPILGAEEAFSSGVDPVGVNPPEEYRESWTWTFYKLRTAKGYVDIRWYGSSNGYYSESVDVVAI